MAKKMETPMAYWGYIRIVGKKMETSNCNQVCIRVRMEYILVLYWDEGEENGKYCLGFQQFLWSPSFSRTRHLILPRKK